MHDFHDLRDGDNWGRRIAIDGVEFINVGPITYTGITTKLHNNNRLTQGTVLYREMTINQLWEAINHGVPRRDGSGHQLDLLVERITEGARPFYEPRQLRERPFPCIARIINLINAQRAAYCYHGSMEPVTYGIHAPLQCRDLSYEEPLATLHVGWQLPFVLARAVFAELHELGYELRS